MIQNVKVPLEKKLDKFHHKMSVLACLLHLLSSALVALAQSSSGAGGDDDACTECVPPTGALPLANLTTNSTEAILEARCLAMCLHLQVSQRC